MAKATVVRWTDRGFGFIRTESGEEIFFCATGANPETKNPMTRRLSKEPSYGDEIEGDIVADTRGRGNRMIHWRYI